MVTKRAIKTTVRGARSRMAASAIGGAAHAQEALLAPPERGNVQIAHCGETKRCPLETM